MAKLKFRQEVIDNDYIGAYVVNAVKGNHGRIIDTFTSQDEALSFMAEYKTAHPDEKVAYTHVRSTSLQEWMVVELEE